MSHGSNNEIIKQALSILCKIAKQYNMEGDIKILSWPTLDPYFRRSFEELERDFKPEIWKNMEKCSDRYS